MKWWPATPACLMYLSHLNFSSLYIIGFKLYILVLTTTTLMEQKLDELQIKSSYLKEGAGTFRAINNKVRLQILHLLHTNQRMNVTSLYEKLRLEQSATSGHLAVLRKAGLVNTQIEDKYRYYSVNYGRIKELHLYAEKLTSVDEVSKD